MDSKRKKIYIAVLVVCVILLVGVLFWSKSSTPEAPILTGSSAPVATQPTTTRPSSEVEINTDGVYPAPALFPQSKNFDASAIKDLKLMKSINGLKLTEDELGRTNPLAEY